MSSVGSSARRDGGVNRPVSSAAESPQQLRRISQSVRRELQQSAESTAALARRFNINVKTAAKWRAREFLEDLPSRNHRRRVNVLSPIQEQAIVLARWCMRLPLDDLLFVIQAIHPTVTRSVLHRCLQKYGISSIPRTPPQRTGKGPEFGEFVVKLLTVPTAAGPLTTWSAMDLRSRFGFAELRYDVTPTWSAKCLASLCDAVPYPIRSVLTADLPAFCSSVGANDAEAHPFAAEAKKRGISHRIVPPSYPWRPEHHVQINRLAAQAACEDVITLTETEIGRHLVEFIVNMNFVRRLKCLGGVTPFQFAARHDGFDWRSYLRNCPYDLRATKHLVPAP